MKAIITEISAYGAVMCSALVIGLQMLGHPMASLAALLVGLALIGVNVAASH